MVTEGLACLARISATAPGPRGSRITNSGLIGRVTPGAPTLRMSCRLRGRPGLSRSGDRGTRVVEIPPHRAVPIGEHSGGRRLDRLGGDGHQSIQELLEITAVRHD